MKPNVFKSCSSASGNNAKDATAIDGSINSFFLLARMVVAERIDGHPAGLHKAVPMR